MQCTTSRPFLACLPTSLPRSVTKHLFDWLSEEFEGWDALYLPFQGTFGNHGSQVKHGSPRDEMLVSCLPEKIDHRAVSSNEHRLLRAIVSRTVLLLGSFLPPTPFPVLFFLFFFNPSLVLSALLARNLWWRGGDGGKQSI